MPGQVVRDLRPIAPGALGAQNRVIAVTGKPGPQVTGHGPQEEPPPFFAAFLTEKVPAKKGGVRGKVRRWLLVTAS